MSHLLILSTDRGTSTNKYLQKSSITRVCAVGGFFVSIPVFLTGIILYTFIQFHSTPAIVTSVFIGLGIIFCGCAMVHNVFVWQKVSTISSSMDGWNKKFAKKKTEKMSHLHHNGYTTVYIYIYIYIYTHHTHLKSSHGISEKTNAVRALAQQQHREREQQQQQQSLRQPTPPTPIDINKPPTCHPRDASGSVSPGVPTATLDLSSVTTATSPHELSTLNIQGYQTS
ncbi:hypothetical protein L9F63_028047, partial [Diploptera punctata]